MINLKRINLKNFLSHADTELAFLDNTKLLIDGKSGNGKSAIPEALIWCLYGESRTTNRDLVRHGEKNASVEVELFDETTGKTYIIERKTTTAAKNSLSISESVDGKNFTAAKTLGIKDTQNFIEKDLLHASYELFINSVAIPQDNVNSFVKQTASKRKDLLLEIANVSNFDEYYNKAKDLLSEKNETLIKRESAIEQKNNLIITQKEFLVEKKPIEEKIKEIDNSVFGNTVILNDLERSQQINSEKAVKIKELKSTIDTHEREIFLEEKKIKKIESDIVEIRKIDVEKMEKEVTILELLSTEFTELEKLMKAEYERQSLLNSILVDKPSDRDYESEIKILQDKLEPLTTTAHSCPAGANCPFIKPVQAQIAYFVEQIQEKQLKRDLLEKNKTIYQNRLLTVGVPLFTDEKRKRYDELKTKLKYLAVLKNEISNAMVSIMSIPSKESEIKELDIPLSSKKLLVSSNKALLETLEEELRKILLTDTTQIYLNVKKDIKTLETEKDSLKNTLAKSDYAEKLIEGLSKEVKDLQKDIKNDSIEVEQLTFIKDAFGSKGLKTVVVDYLIPRLEERINDILSKLSDFTVRLDTQKTSADGEGTVEGLYINITDSLGQETGFDSFSGGEKVKITIAISEALASLQQCGFRILDEAVIALDKESTESLVLVLGKIQERFKQMICISHLDEVKDIFEESVEVIKINGTSTIKCQD